MGAHMAVLTWRADGMVSSEFEAAAPHTRMINKPLPGKPRAHMAVLTWRADGMVSSEFEAAAPISIHLAIFPLYFRAPTSIHLASGPILICTDESGISSSRPTFGVIYAS